MSIQKPQIYFQTTGVMCPRANAFSKKDRMVFDKRHLNGQSVFLMSPDGRIWLWRKIEHGPMFESWSEFVAFYRNEAIEYKG